MRILITNNTLSAFAGSERVVIELAIALQARGHQVAACSCNLGPVGAVMREEQVAVIRDPGDSPFVPDIIHGQHHLDTMRALFRLPGTPAVFHCHGGLPWIERAPVHPRILHYIGMCDMVADWLQIELGLPPARVHALPNWVDTRRFHTVRCPPDRPKKALVFTRMIQPGYFAGELAAAFQERGIHLDLSLPCEGGQTRYPESLLPDYDIVLAAGRSALEAMACGCATMAVSHHSSLGFVDPMNFDALRAGNFAPPRATPQWTRESIGCQLDAYAAANAAAVTTRIRAEAGLDHAVDGLEHIYRATLSDWSTIDQPGMAEELASAAGYVQSLMPMLQNLGEMWKIQGERYACILEQEIIINDLRSQAHARQRLLEKREASLLELKQANKALARENTDRQAMRAILGELRRSIAGRLLLHFARKRLR